VHAWVDEFLAAASAAHAGLQPPTAREFEAWLGQRLAGFRLALFVSYDGALAPVAEDPTPPPLALAMRSALRACAERADLDVAIVSSRSLHELQTLVGGPSLTYVGDHGFEIAAPDLPRFRYPDLVHFRDKLVALATELEALAEDGARIHRKEATITVDYRGVEPPRRGAVVERARAQIAAAGFQPRDGLFAVEARPPIGWDTGQAVLHIMRQRYGPAWSERVRVVYIGADPSDEDAFRVLAGLGATVRVGSADSLTLAERWLPNVEAARALLEWLAGRSLAVAGTQAEPAAM
jgi:trehalose 6-phosphate phosphatase